MRVILLILSFVCGLWCWETTPSRIRQSPYVVLLFLRNITEGPQNGTLRSAIEGRFGLCVGAILDQRWLITAKHCGLYVNNINVLLGVEVLHRDHDSEKSPLYTLTVRNRVLHPEENLALYRVSDEISFSQKVGRVELAQVDSMSGTCVISGFQYFPDQRSILLVSLVIPVDKLYHRSEDETLFDVTFVSPQVLDFFLGSPVVCRNRLYGVVTSSNFTTNKLTFKFTPWETHWIMTYSNATLNPALKKRVSKSGSSSLWQRNSCFGVIAAILGLITKM